MKFGIYRCQYSSDKRYYIGEKWISVSIYLPNDFKSPVSTSLFQVIYGEKKYDEQRHPRMMLRTKIKKEI